MVVAVAEDARLVRLTVDNVIDHDGQVAIRLVPPIPVPEPFAAMLTELAANRANMNTAANLRAWGCSPTDAPASPRPWDVRPAVPAPGVAATQTRAAAFRQLVLHAPARSSRVPSTTAREPPPVRHRHRPNLAPLPATRAGS